jgi:hypothetical protein
MGKRFFKAETGTGDSPRVTVTIRKKDRPILERRAAALGQSLGTYLSFVIVYAERLEALSKKDS